MHAEQPIMRSRQHLRVLHHHTKCNGIAKSRRKTITPTSAKKSLMFCVASSYFFISVSIESTISCTAGVLPGTARGGVAPGMTEAGSEVAATPWVPYMRGWPAPRSLAVVSERDSAGPVWLPGETVCIVMSDANALILKSSSTSANVSGVVYCMLELLQQRWLCTVSVQATHSRLRSSIAM